MSVVGAHRHAGDRVADLGEEVEVAERVTGLAFRDRAEQRGDVGVALDVGLLGEVEVPTVRLALAGEGLLEVRRGSACRSVSGMRCSPSGRVRGLRWSWMSR